MSYRIQINKPLVLIGMMGSGKTTIGRKLARKLGLEFYDSDKVIEHNEELSIVDIFEFRGESYFRTQEEKIINQLLVLPNIILSTGEGSFIQESIRELIKSRAISIWLKTDLDTLYERVSRRDTRPQLNQGDKKEILMQLIEERHPVYSEADIVVDIGNVATHMVVDIVLQKLRTYLSSAH